MLHPSYNELMDYVNENAAPQENGEPLVQSRYTLVMAAAKRARQIVDARSKVQTSYTAADKPLSVAVKELYSGEVRILGENEEPDPVFPEEEQADEECAAGSEEETSGDSNEDTENMTPEETDVFAEATDEIISGDEADFAEAGEEITAEDVVDFAESGEEEASAGEEISGEAENGEDA
ncbi:MAG: DNA-directed RNA polymerase subunit omega [Lachnospiraceae bacterium]|nr:DNA-directed RNA polymerase subunit omega [Lachnospiraceae bacterium]